ncbi:alanine racemase [Pseudoalteromonas sp. H105]|uniref:alanine racemase n=1 Tax=Pseudoalteromonas sp. H105 TaxID=1348393 RepID=UPI0007322120|nr:alanine racemase [Pseudoalteromonas sp. H105]KTF15202.1 hypothetical protein ATS75_10455 [Pseudoalteromonas sp. H105]
MVRAIISKKAVLNNIDVIKRSSKNKSRIIWVLKSNAYGHGSVAIARLLPPEDILAVARLSEAVELRDKGVNNRILILEGVYSLEELLIASKLNFDCMVHNDFQLDLYCSVELRKSINVWLKIDTGMHRLGVSIDNAESFLEALSNNINISDNIGFVSHLSTADDTSSAQLQKQAFKFELAYNSFKEAFSLVPSLSNSAAFFYSESLHYSFSRIGIALYGISPFEDIPAQDLGLMPVMTLKATLIAKREVVFGEYVGYGLHWRAPSNTIIGVVSIGYGDGFPRNVLPGVEIRINDRMVNVIGVACMDMLLVELGQDVCDEIGDEVTIWGDECCIEKFAKVQGTIPYELVCNLTSRINYSYD